jgi:colanic acid/amylovoran biosynthesis glycosyltransferase
MRFPVLYHTFVQAHVTGLADQGNDVSVVSARPDLEVLGRRKEQFESKGIQVLYHANEPSRIRGILRRFFSLAQRPSKAFAVLRSKGARKLMEFGANEVFASTVRSTKADYIHVHFGTVAAQLAQALESRAFVVTWHGFDVNTARARGNVDSFQRLFGPQTLHTVNSAFLKERLVDLGAPAERVSVVPMGIDTEAFAYRARSSRNDQPVRILSVGRLHEVKGHSFLIKAMKRLVDEGFNVELRIVGDGELRSELSSLIEELGLSGHVLLMGAKSPSDVVLEMYNSDVFALTGIVAENGAVEAQGVVYLEAQATGLPVVGSNAGGVPDSLLDGETGFLAEPENPESIASALSRLIADSDLRQKFGQNAKAFVESKFTERQMIEAYLSLYSKINEESAKANGGVRR